MGSLSLLIALACVLLGTLVGLFASRAREQPLAGASRAHEAIKGAEEGALLLLAKARKDAEEISRHAADQAKEALARAELAQKQAEALKDEAVKAAADAEALVAARTLRREEILKEREEADKRAKRIIGLAIQRYAGDHVQQRAVTPLHLPSDDMKGRIIGREGRNIRALQEACGVDVIIDDTPETITISGFDPVRREIARIALEKLIQEGRIHPSRIDEAVAEARTELDRIMIETGEHACVDLGVTQVHPEIVKLVGRLQYVYSYAQNVLKHSIECGYLCGLMAAELGQNEMLARRCGLLHDIGKAVSHEQEGGHALVGSQHARKHGEDALVAGAIASHHEEPAPTTLVGNLVVAADLLSASRPGARREMLEGYVKRVADLEAITRRFSGVERSFAIQAGKEVRVLVEPSRVSEAEAQLLAREISKRIEEELSYPGHIKVTVVRETRAVDYAK